VLKIAIDPWSFIKWLREGTAMSANNESSVKECDVTEGMQCYWNSAESNSNIDNNNVKTSVPNDEVEHDLQMAAHYYRLAAERSNSPRSHFNLGFMYQWGLGLKQDFPLAKRHYDLAIGASAMTHEANVPVGLALMALGLHEYLVKITMIVLDEVEDDLKNLFTKFFSRRSGFVEENDPNSGPPSSPHLHGKTKYDVAFSHVFSVESFIIIALTAIVSMLLSCRRTRR
jgi:hypothetical protein